MRGREGERGKMRSRRGRDRKRMRGRDRASERE